MARKKKRAYRKPMNEPQPVVTDKEEEEAFLNFVDQNAKQKSVDQDAMQRSRFSSESSDVGFDENNSGSDSESITSSSSFSGRGGSSPARGSSSSSSDEPAINKGVYELAKKPGRPPKKGKVSKMVTNVKEMSSRGLSSLNRKRKEAEEARQDYRYNKKQLKAAYKVIKKVMEMGETASFNASVDPVSQGIPDYLDDAPMDFGTISMNLCKGVKYLNAEDVFKDVQYIWENCRKYNKKGDYIMYLMKRVKKKFMKYWEAAGLQGERPRRMSGHPYMVPSDDHAMRHNHVDSIFMANHMAGNFSQMQDYFGIIHPSVALSNYNPLYQSHHLQPSTSRPAQVSQLQASTDSYYAGYSQLLPSNDHVTKCTKHDAISTMNHMVEGQMQQDNFVAMQPQSHVLLSTYKQPYQPHQPQAGTVQPPQLSQLHACRNANYLGTQLRQDNYATNLLQSQLLPPSYCQNCQSHQTQPSTNPPSHISQLHAGTENDYAGHSHVSPLPDHSVNQKVKGTRAAVAFVMSGPTHSMQQHQPSSRQLHQSQQSTSKPQMPQSHAGADINNNAGHQHILLTDDSAMGYNEYEPRSPVDCLVGNTSQLQAEQLPRSNSESDESYEPQASTGQPEQLHLSDSESDESHQPQASTGKLEPSQLLATMDASGAERSCLPPVSASERGRRHSQRLSTGLGCENPLVSNHSLRQQPLEGPSNPDPSEQPIQKTKQKTRGRPSSQAPDMWDKFESERVVVSANNLGQPVGPEAFKLSSFLGVIARNGEVAPLTFKDWKAMPDANKEAMWRLIKAKFDIDPLCKHWAMKSLAHKWRNWKAKLKAEHYYPHKTNEERLKDCDERIIPVQWPVLVSYWNSEEMKLLSEQNKANRAKQKGGHTTGSKSYARIREEERAKRPDGKEPSRAELFIRARTRRDGQPVSEAAAEMISKLREEMQKQQTLPSSSDWDDAFFKVMGQEKNGHVRMYGLGVTPTDIWGQRLGCIELMKIALETKRSANEEVNKLLDKLGAMEQKYASMEAQMSRMTSNVQNFFDNTDEPSKVSGTKQGPDNPNYPEDLLQAEAHSSSSSQVPSD